MWVFLILGIIMRKTKIIILLIFISIFLTGCCGNFVCGLDKFVLPDDIEFVQLIAELDTPSKIGSYMWQNFVYEYHPYGLLTPYQLYKSKKGDCNDFSHFATYMAYCNGYEVYQIRIKFKNRNINHWLGIYKEGQYYTFSSNNFYYITRFLNFKDIVNYYCYTASRVWREYEVYDYQSNIIEMGSN